MSMSKKLREARKAAGYTQAQVAKEFEISREAVALWESDKESSTKPDIRKLNKLAELYRVSVRELLGEAAGEEMATEIKAPSLTKEQQKMLLLMSRIDRESRDTWMKVGVLLARRLPERRRKNEDHNPERRLGPNIPLDAHDTSLFNPESMGEIKQPKERKQR